MHVSAWQCKFDGGYNTSPFLPSFLPSLRECYHSISLPGTLAQSCRWDSRYELCAAQSDTLSTVEGKWERKGDLATRIKLSWYFQKQKPYLKQRLVFIKLKTAFFYEEKQILFLPTTSVCFLLSREIDLE